MIKKLAASVREYKKYAVITPLLMVGEVVLECLLPFVISKFLEEILAIDSANSYSF